MGKSSKIERRIDNLDRQSRCLQEYFNNILEDSRDLLYSFNFQTNQYDYLSKSVEAFTGYSPQVVTDRGVDLLIESLHPDDKDEFMSLLNQLQDSTYSENEFTFEYRYRHKDGHYLWRSDSVNVVRDKAGTIISVFGSSRNITADKQSQAETQAALNRFQLLSEATFEGIVVHDNGTFIESNQQFADMFGYKKEEIAGLPGGDLIAPEYRQEVQDKIASGYDQAYEVVALRKDGTTFPALVRARMINFDDQLLRIAVIRDITEEKQRQQKLVESEQKYRDIFQHSPVPMMRSRMTDGKILECNDALASLFGYESQQECLDKGYTVARYANPTDREKFLQRLKKQGRIDRIEMEFQHLNGSSIWVQGYVQLYPEHGYIEGGMVDITASKVLTKTEKQVLAIVLQGKSNKEIAQILSRSIRTIEDHRSHIMHKLGVTNLVELTQKAATLGLNSPP